MKTIIKDTDTDTIQLSKITDDTLANKIVILVEKNNARNWSLLVSNDAGTEWRFAIPALSKYYGRLHTNAYSGRGFNLDGKPLRELLGDMVSETSIFKVLIFDSTKEFGEAFAKGILQ